MKIFKKNIKTLFLSIIILIVFIFTSIEAYSSFSYAIDINNETDLIQASKIEIMSLINDIDNKIIEIDTTIGEIDVVYWKHIINDIEIKNDYILLQEHPETNEIVSYDIQWRDLDKNILYEIEYASFEPVNYYWKKKVAFLTQSDEGYFYNFYDQQDYPVIGWEVRQDNGETILYDTDGHEIGYGIPTPSQYGFSLSGYASDKYPDDWRVFRENADYWFNKWCDNSVSITHPSTSTISSYIKDANNIYFYELAHGDSYHFENSKHERYKSTAWFSTNLKDDMKYRPSMRFAFIGSCEGMDYTGSGSFSYEFRKGSMTNTVTVGFDGMGSCPGWPQSLSWQNYMFKKMDENYTIKHAFDFASARYPEIAPCVVFKGDETIKIFEPKREGELMIYLDKEFYFPGENVNITTINIGNEPLILNDWYVEHKIFNSWETVYVSYDFPGKIGYPYVQINDSIVSDDIFNMSPSDKLTDQFLNLTVFPDDNDEMILDLYLNDTVVIEPPIYIEEIDLSPNIESYQSPEVALILHPGQQITWAWPQIKNDEGAPIIGEYRIKVKYGDKIALSDSFEIGYYLKFKEPINDSFNITPIIDPIYEVKDVFLNLSETPYFVTKEVAFPDSVFIYDGFLIDYENDGIYDAFQSLKYNKITDVKLDKNGNYLIDENGDGEWNYIINVVEGHVSQYIETKETTNDIPGFQLILVLIAMTLIIVWKKRQ